LVNGLRNRLLPIVVLLVLSFVMIGNAPVFAVGGSATSSAIPSDDTPSIGEQIVVDISIDVSAVDPPDNSLGSYTGSLDWNPIVLDYNSYSGIPAGFTSVVNVADVSSGHIAFNGANTSGATGNVTVLEITFDVVGSVSSMLDLRYSAMAAPSPNFANLIPFLTVSDGLVKVASAGSITDTGDIGSNTIKDNTNNALTITTSGDVAKEDSVAISIVAAVEPTPAAFTISSLGISPDEADIGENVNISVRVDNTGETEGVYQLVCKVDGVVVDEKEVTLAGGSGKLVTFTLAIDEAGNKTIDVNELTGSLVVKEAEEEPGEVAEIPTQEIPEEPASSGNQWWIVGLILGACAILIAGGIFIYKRRQRSY